MSTIKPGQRYTWSEINAIGRPVEGDTPSYSVIDSEYNQLDFIFGPVADKASYLLVAVNGEPPDTICHHMRLLLDSVQLALKLGQLIDYKRVYTGIKECQASNIRIEAWQHHWRRVARFNALFDENLYIPDWYIAEMKGQE